MLNITEQQLKDLLNLAYKEGHSGYRDLQESIINDIYQKYVHGGFNNGIKELI